MHAIQFLRSGFVLSALGLTMALLSTGPARAVIYEWVPNPTLPGSFNVATNWDDDGNATPGDDGVPGTTDRVTWNNAAASAYLISFSADIQTEQFTFFTDKVTMDLAGNRWTAQVNPNMMTHPFDYGGGTALSSSWVGRQAGESTTLTLSSSVAPINPLVDNVVRNHTDGAQYRATNVGGYSAGNSTLNINTSLGFGVRMEHTGTFWLQGNSTLNIDGVGSEYTGAGFAVQAGLGAGGNSFTNLTNGGKFTFNGSVITSNGPGLSTINIETGSTLTSGPTEIGQLNSSEVNIKTGGTWNATNAQVGIYHFYDALPISVKITVDGATSSFNSAVPHNSNPALGKVILGTGVAGQDSNAEITLKNGGSLKANNQILLNVLSAGAAGLGRQPNTITMDNGVIHIDGGLSDARTLVNNGIVRGKGTIDRGTSANGFEVINNTVVDLGDISGAPGTGTAVGTLSLVNGNYTQNTTGTTYFDFDPAVSGSNDQIDITGGVATIDGVIDFDALSLNLGPGTWDFVRATTINYTGTDNMLALLSTMNIDGNFTYGIIEIDGEQLLRLQVLPAPEPSTCLLVGLGGIGLIVRSRRKKKSE